MSGNLLLFRPAEQNNALVINQRCLVLDIDLREGRAFLARIRILSGNFLVMLACAICGYRPSENAWNRTTSTLKKLLPFNDAKSRCKLSVAVDLNRFTSLKNIWNQKGLRLPGAEKDDRDHDAAGHNIPKSRVCQRTQMDFRTFTGGSDLLLLPYANPASCRHNRSKSIPMTLAAFGSRLVEVNPGMVLTSRT